MQSDTYNEYINDKKNKIIYYGNLDEVLKHRIGNDNQIISKLPNWPENLYENNNENIIKGDSGSVMERLIKAGKFVYDEEKMCLSKVTNVNNRVSKKKENSENEGDYKYKTITSINTNNHRKMKKIVYNQFDEEKKKIKTNQKVHFKLASQNDMINDNNMLNVKKVKTENKKSKLEDEDWYKEMERLIDENNSSSNSNKAKKIVNKNYSNKINNNHKQIRVAKTSKFPNSKKDEIKVSSFYLDKDNKEFKQYQNLILSPLTNKISNIQLKKIQKKIFNDNTFIAKKNKISNFKNQINFNQSTKDIPKENYKLKELKGKNRKKQKSLDKNIKSRNDKNKIMGYIAGDNFEQKERRRNQSFQKRNKKIKI